MCAAAAAAGQTSQTGAGLKTTPAGSDAASSASSEWADAAGVTSVPARSAQSRSRGHVQVTGVLNRRAAWCGTARRLGMIVE